MKGLASVWSLVTLILPTFICAQANRPQHVLQPGATSIDSTARSRAQTRWFDETQLLRLHRILVGIESITGNEHAVGEFLADYLSLPPFNLRVEKQAVSPADSSSAAKPRFNVFAYRAGHRKTRTLLTSHIDTVPPWIAYRREKNATHDLLWGRGTNDAKGSVAAQVMAYAELLREGKIEEGDVSLLFVVGEETGGDGMRAASSGLNTTWDAVVFGEPTEGKLVSGHKGMLSFKVHMRGVNAHSGYPWLGKSANSMLVPILKALEEVKLPNSEKYGETTLNLGRVEGGVAANVVAEQASVQALVRIAAGQPEETRSLILQALMKAAKEAIGDDTRAKVEVEFALGGYGPIDIDHDIEGFGEPITVNYGTDVPNLEGAHKRYLYGPGSILVAHSDHEYVSVESLETAVKDYKKIVLQTLKKS